MESQDDSSPDAEHRANVLQQQQAISDNVGSFRSLTAALCKHLRSLAACKHYGSTYLWVANHIEGEARAPGHLVTQLQPATFKSKGQNSDEQGTSLKAVNLALVP